MISSSTTQVSVETKRSKSAFSTLNLHVTEFQSSWNLHFDSHLLCVWNHLAASLKPLQYLVCKALFILLANITVQVKG